MPKIRFRHIIISSLVLLFIGAGLPKMYAGSVLLSKRISLTVQKQSIETVLHLVEKKADVQFMYNPQMFKAKRLISVSLQNASVQDILKAILNNKDLAFYEMGKYIVITKKNDAPIQANAIVAYLEPTDNPMQSTPKLLVDTIHFYDTIRVTKTETKQVVVQDTVTVYDTITKIITQVVPQPIAPKVEKQGTSQWFTQFSVAPLYSKILNQCKDNFYNSLTGEASIGYKYNNVRFSIGIGELSYKGSTKSIQSSISSDSVLLKDTSYVMIKYKTEDVFYVEGNDTIHKVLYDSTRSAVPHQWYNSTRHEKNTESTVTYSILWIIIPCKIEYEWTLSKTISLGLGLTVSPAFAYRKSGQRYDSQQQKLVPIAESGIESFALFSSFEPSLSVALTETISIQCSPIMQCSMRSLFKESSYYVGGGVRFGIRKSF